MLLAAHPIAVRTPARSPAQRGAQDGGWPADSVQYMVIHQSQSPRQRRTGTPQRLVCLATSGRQLRPVCLPACLLGTRHWQGSDRRHPRYTQVLQAEHIQNELTLQCKVQMRTACPCPAVPSCPCPCPCPCLCPCRASRRSVASALPACAAASPRRVRAARAPGAGQARSDHPEGGQSRARALQYRRKGAPPRGTRGPESEFRCPPPASFCGSAKGHCGAGTSPPSPIPWAET